MSIKRKELTMLRHVWPNLLIVTCVLEGNDFVVVVGLVIGNEDQADGQILDTQYVLKVKLMC